MNRKERVKIFVNVHLVLLKEGRILLSLRQNTGYEDGRYGLVSGHLEEGESITQGMKREVKEEIGITPTHLYSEPSKSWISASVKARSNSPF